jgi:hypothetical protein
MIFRDLMGSWRNEKKLEQTYCRDEFNGSNQKDIANENGSFSFLAGHIITV